MAGQLARRAEFPANCQNVLQLPLPPRVLSATDAPKRTSTLCEKYFRLQLQCGVTEISMAHREDAVVENSFLRQPILGHLMRHDYGKAMTFACMPNESEDAPVSYDMYRQWRSLTRRKAGFTKQFRVMMTSAKTRGWRCGNHHQPASLLSAASTNKSLNPIVLHHRHV
jgi:hypothetical protein